MWNHNKATAAIITAGILWGVISLFVRRLYEYGLTPIQITFIRLITAAAVLTVYTAVTNPSLLKFKFRDIWMFAGTGIVSIVLFNCCYFYAMIHGEASVAVVLLYTSPIFIMLISRLIFREKINIYKIAALILTVLGCVCVSEFIGSGYKISLSVLVIGIGSGLFYGLYTIFGKLALAKYDSLTVTVYTLILGALGTLPFCSLGKTARCIAAEPKMLVSCIGIGIFCTLLPYCLYTIGLKNAEAGKAAILVAVEPLVGTIIGMTILKEDISLLKIIGITLILASIILLSKNTITED